MKYSNMLCVKHCAVMRKEFLVCCKPCYKSIISKITGLFCCNCKQMTSNTRIFHLLNYFFVILRIRTHPADVRRFHVLIFCYRNQSLYVNRTFNDERVDFIFIHSIIA